METIKLLIKGLITNVISTIVLFISAGKIDYKQGWIFLLVNFMTTFLNIFTIRNNSELASERSKLGEGIKSWDKLLLGLSAIVYFIMIVIAGLDSGRYLWSSEFSWIISIIGVVIMFIGQALFLTARSQNNFFSSVVRIQRERGHVVCDSGLYKIVRHPGYCGMILSLISVPFITVSLWCFIPTGIAVILILIRTSLEDKTLREELVGYIEYSNKTRYKLIPYIW